SMLPRKTARMVRSQLLKLRSRRIASSLLSIAIVAGFAARASGASPSITSVPTPAPSAAHSAAATSAPSPSVIATPIPEVHAASPQSVLSYLSDAINWYRHLNVEAQLVEEPSETLYYAEDRQTASDILALSFDYARRAADFLAKSADKNLTSSGARQSTSAIGAKLAAIQQELTEAQARLKGLQAQFARARGKDRDVAASQIVATQGEIDLAQA